MRASFSIQTMLIVATCSAVGAPTFADAGAVTAGGQDGPRILGSLAPQTRALLRRSFERAQLYAQVPECKALFHDLDAEALVELSHAIYSGPSFSPEVARCRGQRVAAFTNVGPGRTIICPGFAQLRSHEAATVLLHEALHNAGQTEWPFDPEAPTPARIQARVRKHCRS